MSEKCPELDQFRTCTSLLTLCLNLSFQMLLFSPGWSCPPPPSVLRIMVEEAGLIAVLIETSGPSALSCPPPLLRSEEAVPV